MIWPRRRICRRAARLLQSGAVSLAITACAPAGDDHAATLRPPPPTPPEHAQGARLFVANCGSCHGEAARGTAQGPPLVHKVYEPSHHSDAAFHLAARTGVAAHHWRFGNMPPQPQVNEPQMIQIIGYVRFLQRDAGIN